MSGLDPSQLHNIGVWGLSHRTASVEVREKFALDPEQRATLYRECLGHELVSGLVILNTCNRFEVYFEGDVSAGPQRIREFVEAQLSIAGESIPYYHEYSELAVNHLFKVVSGLDSMVLGEPQIAGQVKEAYSEALKFNGSTPFLNKLFHQAFYTSKRVRTETEIQHQPVSVPYAAVVLAEQIFESLTDKKILLIGAGEMCELAAQHFVERKVASLQVANRSGERAMALAERFGGVALPFEDFTSHLSEVDIVLTSTASRDYLLSYEDVQSAMRRRKNRSMLFLDIGVPRDVDPQVNDIDNVYHFDIDNLQQVVDGNLKERRKAAAQAEELILNEVADFRSYLQQRDKSAVIKDLLDHVERLQQQELDRLRNADWSEEQLAQWNHEQRSLSRKLLHPVLEWLKQDDTSPAAIDKEALIRELFRI